MARLPAEKVPDAVGTDRTEFFACKFVSYKHGEVTVQDGEDSIVVPSIDVAVQPMQEYGSGVQFEPRELVLARWPRSTGCYAAEVLRRDGGDVLLRFANDPGHEDGRKIKIKDVFRHPPREGVDVEDSDDLVDDLLEALDEGSDELDPTTGVGDDGAGEEPETGDDGDEPPAGTVPGRGAPTPRPRRGAAAPVTQSGPRRPRSSTGPAPVAPQKAPRYSLRGQGRRGTR